MKGHIVLDLFGRGHFFSINSIPTSVSRSNWIRVELNRVSASWLNLSNQNITNQASKKIVDAIGNHLRQSLKNITTPNNTHSDL